MNTTVDSALNTNYVLTVRQANHAVRWQENERLEHLFEQRCDALEELNREAHPAVIGCDETLSYSDLDKRANQLARYLVKRGVKPGDRVGLLLDKSPWCYAGLLAVLKAGAAYVPLDASFPRDRISYILTDACANIVVSLTSLADSLTDIDVTMIYLDREIASINAEPDERLTGFEQCPTVDELAYIIYTSGTTGKPKGVAVNHSSICNFVKVAGEAYGLRRDHRVYQGMTIAFDFSVEEIWVPLWVGATLIPSPPDAKLLGNDLANFLKANAVTALCCVPTLLATLDEVLPDVDFLLVSGEACPRDLVDRWHAPGRRFLNAYGPTEATVSTTLAELRPDTPVTIGAPLPTYSVVILERDRAATVAPGESGEIGVAGIGLALGYVNREEQTKRSFIDDFIGIANNPSRRIYRTGDLGRINEHDEIEYLGRIDTQVKVRGYRIELTEIESVLLRIPQIAAAVVDTYEPEPGALELVAYYTLKQGATELNQKDIAAQLHDHLPGYMVPAFCEQLPSIPMLPSNKADRKRLPPPRGPRFVNRDTDRVAPRSELEKSLASALAETMKIDRISVTDHFFEDLGAHSLLMAKFCAKLREQLPHTDVSMRDVYQHPTIAVLANYLDTKWKVEPACAAPENYRIPTNLEYYGCGMLQLISYGVYVFLGFWVLIQGVIWAVEGSTWLTLSVRFTTFAVALFVVSSALPIAMKWLVIGKWKAERIPIWSMRYFCFWVVKWLISNNPMAMFKGLPLYNLYLRLLGARIGKHVVIDAKYIPVCTDLLDIADGTLIRKDAFMLGYKARSGYILTGPIRIGQNAYVGEGAVLDIHSTMEDNTQLGHASALHENQTVPAGKHYHGSPAEETFSNYCAVQPVKCTTFRRTVYTALQLFSLFIVSPVLAASVVYWLRGALTSETHASIFPQLRDVVLTFNLADLALISAGLFFGFILLSLLLIAVVPRLLNLLLEEGRVYVLFGVHYWIVQSIRALSNSRFLNTLFGDSSAVVYYLKFIGYDLSRKIVQSGSNFGVEQKHDNPLLCSFGTGTMAADGLAMSNIQMSSSSFKLSRTTLGEHNYIGNDIYYPPDGKTGNNCLLATKVMIPIDGEMIEDTGLLGSPPFRIPRMVDQDRVLSRTTDESIRRQRLREKNVHNLVTALSFLFWHWLFAFIVLVIVNSSVQMFDTMGIFALLLVPVLMTFIYIGYYVAIERTSMALARLKPQIASIYDLVFWKVERYWKHSDDNLKAMFAGTPFKNTVTRLSGAKVGRKVFDDGAALSEKGLVDIGDYCTFNAEGGLQSHSLEEGVFKCDYIRMGAGCTVGPNVLVHYGTTMEDNVVIETDSFLMKGEIAKSNSIWRGNPAKQV